MSNKSSLVIIGVIICFAVISVYTQQNNKLSLSKLNSQLNNMQVQVNRGSNRELIELNDQQKQALNDATKRVLDARRALIETELEIGLITEEEAQFFKEHLELMHKYDQDYTSPAWGWDHRGMMRRHHR